MTTQARRQLEFTQREKLFLEEAHRQICAEGLLSLHMAKVARACNYATGTLYQHFASKEDMLLALSTEMIGTRQAFIQRAVDWKASSRDRQCALIVADVLFAKRYPEHFRLAQYVGTQVVWGAASAQRRQLMLAACEPLTKMIRGIAEDAVTAGDLDIHGHSSFEAMLGPWTMLLGMHTLIYSEGLMEKLELSQPYQLLFRLVHQLLNGMGWRPLVDAYDEAQLLAIKKRILTGVFADLSDQHE